MADRHRGKVAFLLVYIREAHPEEGWILPENRRSGVAVHEPTTVAERAEVAASTDGRIAFQGGEGPFGFKPAELDRAIEAVA
jgi:hypothetical protein